MSSDARTSIILPSEIWAREFDAKLLLACCLASKGFPVYVGCKNTIHMNITSFPRGLYLAKDFRVSSDLMFDILTRLGHSIMAWDEEATLPFETQEYITIRVSPPAFGKVSEFFAWGAANKEALDIVPGLNGAKVHLTGNPRGDLMREELHGYFAPEVDVLRQKYGRFILINSNFGKLNHFVDSQRWAPGEVDRTMRGRPNSELFEKKNEHKYLLFQSFLKLVPELARAFPDRKIVVRPHPTESFETWRQAGAGFDNVEVANEGHVHAWLHACEVMVHSGCTTGMEGYLLNRPVFGYHPVVSEESQTNLPNRLSHSVFSQEELLEQIHAVFGSKFTPAKSAELDELIAPIISSLDGPFASDQIANIVENYLTSGRLNGSAAWPNKAVGWAKANARAAKKRFDYANPRSKCNLEYDRHRFPLISADDVRERVGRYQNILGRFDGVDVSSFRGNVFRIA